jgi:hypothetical protein
MTVKKNQWENDCDCDSEEESETKFGWFMIRSKEFDKRFRRFHWKWIGEFRLYGFLWVIERESWHQRHTQFQFQGFDIQTQASYCYSVPTNIVSALNCITIQFLVTSCFMRNLGTHFPMSVLDLLLLCQSHNHRL